uniref:DUF2231 domain-containing protein n=1 Tax=Pararhizobium sp. IMCC3301 TaxID=3067904 RepID=UPI002740CF3B|nr:hypothetical protein [Pararhizobium sp. IMCC3301]
MNRPADTQNPSTNARKEADMKRPGLMRRGRRIGLATAALMLAATGAALAHSEGGGVAVAVEGTPAFSLSPVYHILVAHFPVGLWMTAYLFILIRSFSDSEFAVRLQKAIWPVAALGTLAGFVTYSLGLTIYPWSAITESPLGRNHIMLATWTLSYWTVMSVLGYRFRRNLFDGGQRWVTFTLATIGALVITITGTLGGSLTGTPSLVTKSLSYIGWNVYMTFYLPTWMLLVYGLGAVLLIAIGIVGWRRHA